ncbi:hypothetical protein FB566_4604 [Stackebrandtia endophytica]|uniref:Uncharacterized protein n=2 Tax=Stackebrandtia endophytica TaxID=1496996 RepID=A0A543B2E9_9ACTN|nr:hypothetical protein FB566_4604 [Stackebrandtia endophytica]
MQFGPWDLVIQYLFPDVWVLPVVASIFAWIGAVQFWRKWGPRLLARASAAMPTIGGALASIVIRANQVPLPSGPRQVVRLLVAAPFFMVWLAGFVIWYLLGSIPNSAGIGREGLDLSPTGLSIFLGLYGIVAMVVATVFVIPADREPGWRGPVVISLFVAAPAMAFTLLMLVLEFVISLLALQLRFSSGGLLFIPMILLSFLLPTAALQGGMSIVRAR